MANEYYLLSDDPKTGKSMMSLEAIGNIAKTSLRNVKDAYTFKKDSETCKVRMSKGGDIDIDIVIKIMQGSDIAKVCEDLQREVYDHLLDMAGIRPRSVNIDVAGFISDKDEIEGV